MVPEAKLERTEAGLVPVTPGWFVMNVRDARWIDRGGRGYSAPMTGWKDEEAETLFPQLGLQIAALDPGKPLSMYHWETDQEDFLILAGDAILIVEGQERPLRQWDFAHTPSGAAHTIVAGENGCVVLAVGSRENQATGPWGAYTVDETAIRHGAGVEEETQEPTVAYARFSESKPTPYAGWLD